MRRLSRHGRTRARRPGQALILLLAPLAALLLALGGLVRAYAMPAEARSQERWYAYSHQIAYDFTAHVTAGEIYPADQMRAPDLLRTRPPVDPPLYRRVLLSRLTESVTLSFPYTFEADRPGEIRATYWAEGTLTVPGLWQRPYALAPPRQLTVAGWSLSLGDFAVVIPVQEIIRDLERLTAEMRLNHDQAEVRVRPVIRVEVGGLQAPVAAEMTTDLVLAIRGVNHTLEVDEPRLVRESKSLEETRVTPATVTLLGRAHRVAAVRSWALGAISLCSLILAGILVYRRLRQPPDPDDLLDRLGSSLIRARSFEPPPGVALVDLAGVKQLLTLHLQTERPVVRTPAACFLVDGSTCYRLLCVSPEAEG